MRSYGPTSPWDLDPAITFLNHGSFGACPRPVLERQAALRAELEANPIRFLGREFEPRLDEARATLARFIGADPEGCVVVPNATTGVSTVLGSLRFRPGDEILTTNHEYNAIGNAISLAATAARGAVVTARIPLPIRHPEEVVEAILAAVTPRTRLAVVSHVTSTTGLVLPIEAIVRELDRLGVDTLVDAAHAPGMVPVDVTALGAAYWTANNHKWLCGPKVSGILHVRTDRRAGIRPLVTSHGYNDPRTDRPPLWKAFDWPGTSDPTPFLAMPSAIETLGGLLDGGWPALMAANRAMALDGRARLGEALATEPIAPGSMVGSMAAVVVPGLATDEEADALRRSLAERERIEVAIGGWPVPAARPRPDAPPSRIVLRFSAQRYVEPADLDTLIAALAERRLGAPKAAAAPA